MSNYKEFIQLQQSKMFTLWTYNIIRRHKTVILEGALKRQNNYNYFLNTMVTINDFNVMHVYSIEKGLERGLCYDKMVNFSARIFDSCYASHSNLHSEVSWFIPQCIFLSLLIKVKKNIPRFLIKIYPCFFSKDFDTMVDQIRSPPVRCLSYKYYEKGVLNLCHLLLYYHPTNYNQLRANDLLS